MSGHFPHYVIDTLDSHTNTLSAHNDSIRSLSEGLVALTAAVNCLNAALADGTFGRPLRRRWWQLLKERVS